MKIKFYLKRPNGEKETAIFALASYNGYSIKIYTGESIAPKFWHSKENKAIIDFLNHDHLNKHLDDIKNFIHAVLLEFKLKNEGMIPDAKSFKLSIEKSLKIGVLKIPKRICCTCKLPLELYEFGISNSHIDGLDPRCKRCTKESKMVNSGGWDKNLIKNNPEIVDSLILISKINNMSKKSGSSNLPFNNITSLRDDLGIRYSEVINNDMEVKKAGVVANIAGKIIGTCNTQQRERVRLKDSRPIKFLNGD